MPKQKYQHLAALVQHSAVPCAAISIATKKSALYVSENTSLSIALPCILRQHRQFMAADNVNVEILMRL